MKGDQFLLYLRNLPSKVQEFLQLHQNAVTVQQLKTGVQDYYIRTRVQGDLGSVHVAQPVGKPDVKDKTCFNCGKKGHLAENCTEPKKCSHCGKKGHLAKDCWEKHPDKKPTAKPKAKGCSERHGATLFAKIQQRRLRRCSSCCAVGKVCPLPTIIDSLDSNARLLRHGICSFQL